MNPHDFQSLIKRWIERIDQRISRSEYDINIAVLANLQGKYLHRFEMFKRFGLMNFGNRSVHVTLLVNSIDDSDAIVAVLSGWQGVADLSVLWMRSNDPIPCINSYYAWLDFHGPKARWHMRIDDDSITDIARTLEFADSQYIDCPVHLVTSPRNEERCPEEFDRYLHESGYTCASKKHEYESSLTSETGMRAIFECPAARHLLVETAERIKRPGDIALALGAHLASVHVADNPLSTFEFRIRESTLLPGGSLTHIHYVPWEQPGFVKTISAHSEMERVSLKKALFQNKIGQPGIFGEAFTEHPRDIVLHEDGSVATRFPGIQRWSWSGRSLALETVEGTSQAQFQIAAVSGGELWLFGRSLSDGRAFTINWN